MNILSSAIILFQLRSNLIFVLSRWDEAFGTAAINADEQLDCNIVVR